VFTQAWEHQVGPRNRLGEPLKSGVIQRLMTQLIEEANAPRITVHGLRHTCATLLLKSGVPAHVVQQRLDHRSVVTTLKIYAHVLPSMQQDAADRLEALLRVL
jgi:integrase